ncbi:hypothetical protein scyTo_0012967 [Scyliorhinus torazame]|uniref:Uncharacterized protein n=1 Tax=Scyliorhinus torazame TaxID=75743 RepID=A0A401NLP1_SCYTO|nr:hypothetical protein [Scyliorhinus torazame]
MGTSSEGGISDGYMEEKASLERQIQKEAEIQQQNTQELQHTSNHLHEIEEEQNEPQQGRELLTRQQVVMKGTVELQELSISFHKGDAVRDDTRIWSGGTDGGLKLSHCFTESIVCGGIWRLKSWYKSSPNSQPLFNTQ